MIERFNTKEKIHVRYSSLIFDRNTMDIVDDKNETLDCVTGSSNEEEIKVQSDTTTTTSS